MTEKTKVHAVISKRRMNLIKNVIEKLESAVEGSRQLDGLIWQALGNRVPRQPNWQDVVPSPHYTTNLVDALTLVDDRYDGYTLRTHTIRQQFSLQCHAKSSDQNHYGEASTSELAVCIACLKAIEFLKRSNK